MQPDESNFVGQLSSSQIAETGTKDKYQRQEVQERLSVNSPVIDLEDGEASLLGDLSFFVLRGVRVLKH
jgi:hypothetical protein